MDDPGGRLGRDVRPRAVAGVGAAGLVAMRGLRSVVVVLVVAGCGNFLPLLAPQPTSALGPVVDEAMASDPVPTTADQVTASIESAFAAALATGPWTLTCRRPCPDTVGSAQIADVQEMVEKDWNSCQQVDDPSAVEGSFPGGQVRSQCAATAIHLYWAYRRRHEQPFMTTIRDLLNYVKTRPDVSDERKNDIVQRIRECTYFLHDPERFC
jgi:hypothetical protein